MHVNEMRKSRFLYVGTFQLPDRNAAAQRVTGVALLLRRLGYDVTFLDLNKSIDAPFTTECVRHEGFETCSIRYPRSFKDWLRHAATPERVAETLALHDDWCGVIAYNYPGLALLRLKKLCKRRNLKLLADCTEWFAPYVSLNPHELATNVDSFIRMRIAHKKCDGMIAISSFLSEYYGKCFPCVTLPPVIDRSNAKWTRRPKEKTGSCRRLCYAGSPGANMGKDRLNIMIEAFFQCGFDRLSLDIAGITRENYEAMFPQHHEMIETLTAADRLRFHGRLAHQAALDLLRSSDFSIFYRKDDRMTRAGFPTKFVESISCGVPVITTITSDLGRYLRDGKNGLVIEAPAGLKQLKKVFAEAAEMPVPPPVDDAIFEMEKYQTAMSKFLGEIEL